MNNNESTQDLRATPPKRSFPPLLIAIIVILAVLCVLGVWMIFRLLGSSTSSEVPIEDTTGNLAEGGYVAYTPTDYYLPNFNEAGTISKLNVDGDAEVIADIENSKADISNLQIYNGSLYFISYVNGVSDVDLYRKDLGSDEEAEHLLTIPTEPGYTLYYVILNDFVYVYLSDTYNQNNTLTKYSLDGEKVDSVSTEIRNLTTDGEYLYGLSLEAVLKYDQDLNEETIYTFNPPAYPGLDCMCYGNHLYFDFGSENNSKGSIATITTDGKDLETVVEYEYPYNDYPNDYLGVAFNAYQNFLYVMYDLPGSEKYKITRINLENYQEETLLEADDNYPDSGVNESTEIINTKLFVTENGLITLRVFDLPIVGIYSLVDYNGENSKYLGEYVLPDYSY